jgi:hypothetical protein
VPAQVAFSPPGHSGPWPTWRPSPSFFSGQCLRAATRSCAAAPYAAVHRPSPRSSGRIELQSHSLHFPSSHGTNPLTSSRVTGLHLNMHYRHPAGRLPSPPPPVYKAAMPRPFAPQHFAPSNSTSPRLHMLYTELHRHHFFLSAASLSLSSHQPVKPSVRLPIIPSRGELPRCSTAARAHSGESAARLGRRSTVDQ